MKKKGTGNNKCSSRRRHYPSCQSSLEGQIRSRVKHGPMGFTTTGPRMEKTTLTSTAATESPRKHLINLVTQPLPLSFVSAFVTRKVSIDFKVAQPYHHPADFRLSGCAPVTGPWFSTGPLHIKGSDYNPPTNHPRRHARFLGPATRTPKPCVRNVAWRRARAFVSRRHGDIGALCGKGPAASVLSRPAARMPTDISRVQASNTTSSCVQTAKLRV